MQNKKIKICHVTGADMAIKFLLLPQLSFLRKEGYDVSIVCSSGKWIEEIRGRGFNVKTIEIKRKLFSPISDLMALSQLFFYFKKERFDIVHTHTPKPGLLGQLAAKFVGVPIIINTIHGLYFNEKSSAVKRNFFINIERIAARCSDLIFSQNREDMETMKREKITNPAKIKYLGNGVDIKRFNLNNFSEESIDEKRKELKIENDCKIVGTIGRLVKEKGYLDLFEAFKLVLKVFPKTILLVIGPKEPFKKDGLKPEIAKNYGIEKNVIFLGEKENVEEFYPIMDIFVLASHREGFPRTVLEAMAMKRPVIATDIRGCREEIDNGKNGILVPSKNHLELSKAIISLLGNKQKSDEIAAEAMVKSEREFDERLVFDRIKKEYDKLIAERLKR